MNFFLLILECFIVATTIQYTIKYFVMRKGMRHELWKRGIYCSKCGKEFHTNSYLMLILWSDYHTIKCFRFKVDCTSFLLLPKLEVEELMK